MCTLTSNVTSGVARADQQLSNTHVQHIYKTLPCFRGPITAGAVPQGAFLVIYLPGGDPLDSFKIDHRPDIEKIPGRDTVSMRCGIFTSLYKVTHVQSAELLPFLWTDGCSVS